MFGEVAGAASPTCTTRRRTVFADILGRDIAVRSLPWPLLNVLTWPVGLLSERVRDGRAMIGVLPH
jgi:hypothetical protein